MRARLMAFVFHRGDEMIGNQDRLRREKRDFMRKNTPICLALGALVLLAAACDADDDKGARPIDGAVADASAPPDVSDAASSADATAPFPCPFVEDGVCDEPASCPLGTDDADCQAACAVEDPPAGLYGACTYRRQGIFRPEPEPAEPPPWASGGSGGRYGLSYGTLEAAGPTAGSTVRRHYVSYVPDSYDPRHAVPLLFYASGFSVPLFGKFPYSDLNRMAELNGFIVVYAEQMMRSMGELGPAQGWHVYQQAFEGDWPANPDLDLFRRLIAEIQTQYNIDRRRVYVSGHSRGAGVAIITAFLAPDVVTGFCAQAGFVGVNAFHELIRSYSGRRMPAVIVHGRQDDDVHPSEGALTARVLTEEGWAEADRLRYYALDQVGHQWQPQITQEWWDFLVERPMEDMP